MIYDSYIAGLRREIAERRAKRTAEAASVITDPRAALREEIAEWQRTLPAEAHEHGYVLEDIRKVIQVTPQQLGLALHELRWRRKRMWLTNGPYRRYWFPPDDRRTQR